MNGAATQPIVVAPPAAVEDASDEEAQVPGQKQIKKMVQHVVQRKLEKNSVEKKIQSVRQTGCCQRNPVKILFYCFRAFEISLKSRDL